MRCARGRRRTGRSASASPSARVQSSRRPRSACSICSSAPARTSTSCSRKPSSSGLRHSTPLVSHGSTSEVIKTLVVNVAIAVAKGIAAVISGSGAMLAETLHSFAECGNQSLLLVVSRSARRPADDKHPLGYGRAMYYYSFIVALLLFFGGGVFSVREGWEKIRHPEPVESITLATAILAFSFLLEGWSLYGNIKEINKRRGAKAFVRYLKDTTDSDLIVVFGENSAAVIGLIFAMIALVLAKETGDGRWDGVGSLVIGLVLLGVATFLGREVKSLLVGVVVVVLLLLLCLLFVVVVLFV